MHKPKAMKWFMAVSAAALFTVAFPTLAQQAPDAPPPTGQAAEMPDDATLDTFADAFGKVMNLQQDFASQLEGVESDEEARAMQQQVQEQMVEAVQQSGMSVEEYNNVATQLDQNPKLREKVMGMVDSAH
ncbi:DUF4168 domain-containing protein [Thiohalomonas denitrificans]|uniref:DUF4168 domain-containing protein n=1 Tax=Thiohalomonas denitrificans TaxID=415747 RepID=A0A1G5Q440_9GAMM|nr:DUF4168 domain-containing protein [Thiohalomonas denitrificans]SCZ56230.1 protein of unknown function [Thiohalomonas denitrificans]